MKSARSLPRTVFRSGETASAHNWIDTRITSGLTRLHLLCMSQPASNFGRDDLPALPLFLFCDNALVEVQVSQGNFSLRDYPSEVIVKYAEVSLLQYALKHKLTTNIQNPLPHVELFPAFLDLVAHGPHVDAVILLLKKFLKDTPSNDLPDLKNAMRNALGSNNVHVRRFYELFDTYSDTMLLTDIIVGAAAIESLGAGPVYVPADIGGRLQGSTFVRFKQFYRSDPVTGYVFMTPNGRYLELTCYTATHALEPLNVLPPAAIRLQDRTEFYEDYLA